MNEGHTDQLFEGILESARSEAAEIISRAKRDADLTLATYHKKIAEAVEQEKRFAEMRLVQIKRLEESSARSMERKFEVARGQRLRIATLESVARKMSLLVGTEGYRQVLIGWIAEGVIGLDRFEAVVRCSFTETVDENMLREAEQLVFRFTGRHVTLQFGGATLTGQGVEVSSTDGKVAYNNQVATRLVRHERKLKELMEGQTCHKG